MRPTKCPAVTEGSECFCQHLHAEQLRSLLALQQLEVLMDWAMKTLCRRAQENLRWGGGELWPPASSGLMTVPWWLGLGARRDRWGRGGGTHLSLQHPEIKSSPKLKMLKSKPAEVLTCSVLHKPLRKRFRGTTWRERWQRDAMEFPVSFVGNSCKGWLGPESLPLEVGIQTWHNMQTCSRQQATNVIASQKNVLS